jgi:hypothetical protein
MEKKDILEYVSKTPYNTNINVLGTMLDQLTATLDTIQTTVNFQNDNVKTVLIIGDQSINNIAETLSKELLENNKTTKRIYTNILPTKSFEVLIKAVDDSSLEFEQDGQVHPVNKGTTGFYSIIFSADGEQHTLRVLEGGK